MWNKPKESVPKNKEEVLCFIEDVYEVGVYNATTKKFKHTLGSTSLERVTAWLPIPKCNYTTKKPK